MSCLVLTMCEFFVLFVCLFILCRRVNQSISHNLRRLFSVIGFVFIPFFCELFFYFMFKITALALRFFAIRLSKCVCNHLKELNVFECSIVMTSSTLFFCLPKFLFSFAQIPICMAKYAEIKTRTDKKSSLEISIQFKFFETIDIFALCKQSVTRSIIPLGKPEFYISKNKLQTEKSELWCLGICVL